MKILITGGTPMQAGRTAPYISQCHVIADAAARMGYVVEHRPVTIAEAMKGAPDFDRVVLFQAPYLMLGSHYSLAPLILTQTRPDAVLGFEDWKVNNILWNYQAMVRDPTYIYDKFIGMGKKFRAEVVANPRARKLVEKAVAELANPLWKRPTLVALFPWGSAMKLPEKVRPMFANSTAYDPSPLVPLPPFTARKKTNQWVLATLGNHANWVVDRRLGWPTIPLGYKAERATQPEVVQCYADSWGVLAPAFPVSGAGWWRSRFNFSAHAKSILLCDKSDAAAIAHPSVYGLTAEKIEAMTLAQRAELASEQAKIMQKRTWKKDQLLDVVRGVLNSRRAKAA